MYLLAIIPSSYSVDYKIFIDNNEYNKFQFLHDYLWNLCGRYFIVITTYNQGSKLVEFAYPS